MMILVSCNFEEEVAESSGDLYSDNKVAENLFVLTSQTNKVYKAADTIDIVLAHSFSISVTGAPRVAIDIGGATVYADYLTGNSTKYISFRYTVQPGNTDTDGVVISNTIDLNSGALTFNNNGVVTNALVAFTSNSTPNVLVDTTAPVITLISPPLPLPATFLINESLQFLVIFDDAVLVTGTPRIQIDIGGVTKYATYLSGSNTTTLIFNYKIEGTDVDSDGITLTTPLQLNAGTITDVNGNDSSLAFTLSPAESTVLADIRIDGDKPYISQLTPPQNKTYIYGDLLTLTTKFTEIVNVSGAPILQLTLGTVTKNFNYSSGSGTDTLTFIYSIALGDEDLDGASIASIVALNGGTIQDTTFNNASLNLSTPLTPGILVDAGLPTVTLITPPLAQTYFANQEMLYTVKFDRFVEITGIPRLGILLDSNSPTAVYADYISGAGSNILIFKGTVLGGDLDGTGIDISPTIDLNGATIKASGNNLDADLDITSVVAATNTTAVLVDASPATIVSISPPVNDSYMTNSNLIFTVVYSKAVNVVNTPRIELNIGGVTRYADYIGGTGSTNILFQYTISAADTDNDGVVNSNTSIDLNTTGTITDNYAEAAVLDMTASMPSLSGIFVNFSAVTITSITPPTNKTYIATEDINFIINAIELVNVTGVPRVQLDIGGVTKYANYSSGTGTTALTFTYTVEASLEDTDGIQMISPIDLNSGSIRSASLQSLNINFVPLSMPSVLVDSTAPIVAITVPSNGSFINTITDSSTFTVSGNCNENTFTVIIEVDSGASTTPVNFLCDGTNFTGTIDTTGITEGAHTLTAKLTDAVANEGVSSVINTTKDTIVPLILSSTAPANAYYKLAALVNLTVNHDEVITVTGTPRITLDVGGVTRYADYASGSGTNSLVYSYVVNSIDLDIGGVSFVGSTIDLNSGTLLGPSLNPINLDLTTTVALPSLTGILVDGVIPTVTITSAPNITAANQVNYFASGTCSENTRVVSIDIGGILLTPTCTSNAWSTGSVDVSAIGDNPAVPISAGHSDLAGNDSDQANSTIDKDANTPQVAITVSPDITNANQTGYTISGTCTENSVIVDIFISTINIQPNCSSGTWSSGSIDVSALADNPTIAITADHSTATQVSVNISKDTTSATVIISSSPNISSSNETSYTASGTCSETGTTVFISIGTINLSKPCTTGSWTTGTVNVSALIDNASIAFTADHSNATQAITTISKNTISPTIASISVPSTLANSADLAWTLTDPGGFTINDYEINMRTKGTPTWLNYADGVSTNLTETITSLLASTTYEFRVRVNYDTTFYSDWSVTAEGETKPDDPLFASPYVAMNVGGATDSNVVAFYDNTRIYLNGVEIVGSPINKGVPLNIPGTTAQFDVIDADKPIYTAGRRGDSLNADNDKMNVVWNPTSWAGKSFTNHGVRNTPQKLHIYAIENTVVTVKQGSTILVAATDITASTGAVLSWAPTGAYQVISTGTVLAFTSSGDIGASRYGNPKPLLPSSTEIIGFPSGGLNITTQVDSTNYTAYRGNSSIVTGSINKEEVDIVYSGGELSALFVGYSLLVSSDQIISGACYNNTSGNAAAPFLPTNLMKKNYAINNSANWVAFASKEAGTIEVRDSSDNVIQTLTLSRSGANANAPYSARRAATPTGYRFFATVPVAAWYDADNDVGSAQNDETLLFGTDE
jgi:hypothetical protein